MLCDLFVMIHHPYVMHILWRYVFSGGGSGGKHIMDVCWKQGRSHSLGRHENACVIACAYVKATFDQLCEEERVLNTY